MAGSPARRRPLEKKVAEDGRAGPAVSVRITAVPRTHAPVTDDSFDSSFSLITGKAKLPAYTLKCRFLQYIFLLYYMFKDPRRPEL